MTTPVRPSAGEALRSLRSRALAAARRRVVGPAPPARVGVEGVEPPVARAGVDDAPPRARGRARDAPEHGRRAHGRAGVVAPALVTTGAEHADRAVGRRDGHARHAARGVLAQRRGGVEVHRRPEAPPHGAGRRVERGHRPVEGGRVERAAVRAERRRRDDVAARGGAPAFAPVAVQRERRQVQRAPVRRPVGADRRRGPHRVPALVRPAHVPVGVERVGAAARVADVRRAVRAQLRVALPPAHELPGGGRERRDGAPLLRRRAGRRDAAQDLVARAERDDGPGAEHRRGVDEPAGPDPPAQAPGRGERDEGPVRRAHVDVPGVVEHRGREHATGGVERPRACPAVDPRPDVAGPGVADVVAHRGPQRRRRGAGRVEGGARDGGGQDDEGGEGRAAAGHRRAAYPAPSGA